MSFLPLTKYANGRILISNLEKWKQMWIIPKKNLKLWKVIINLMNACIDIQNTLENNSKNEYNNSNKML